MAILRALLAEWRELDLSRATLRSFGRVVGAVVLGIAAFVAWRRGWTWTPAVVTLTSIGGALVVLGQLAPMLLRPVYQAWMLLALLLGAVVSRILLTLVFVLGILPIGWARRTFSESPILTQPDPDAASYWIKKPPPTLSERERLEKMY
ncbi:MAG: SxtJ family membrane protein [Bacteroidota bacterium]